MFATRLSRPSRWTPKLHVVVLARCFQAPSPRWSGLGTLLGTGNSLSERMHGVRVARSQGNAWRLLNTTLQSSSQLHLADFLPPPHLLARHQPQPCSRRDGSSTPVISEGQTGAVAGRPEAVLASSHLSAPTALAAQESHPAPTACRSGGRNAGSPCTPLEHKARPQRQALLQHRQGVTLLLQTVRQVCCWQSEMTVRAELGHGRRA